MKEFKGTHAPWFVEEQDGEVWVTPEDRDANVICDIVARQSVENLDTKTFEPVLQDEDMANAHLIAAAPDLLEALQAFCDKCDEYNIEILAPEYEAAMTEINKALNLKP